MIRITLLVMLIVVTGCAKPHAPSMPAPRLEESQLIKYQLVDQPDQERFEILYHNDSNSIMCLDSEHWPNTIGMVELSADHSFLLVGNERFPGLGYNGGYCPDGCDIPVAPGEEKIGFILYANFNFPPRLKYEPKKLEHHPTAYVCQE